MSGRKPDNFGTPPDPNSMQNIPRNHGLMAAPTTGTKMGKDGATQENI